MTRNKPVALFIGRFQPFHKGHLSALRWIAARSSRIIVMVGSAQKSYEPENPFTEKERVVMIKKQLIDAGLMGKCAIFSVTDVNDNERWVAHVGSNVPPYDAVYSNNPLVKRLMRKEGKKVFAIPFFRRSLFDATKIRGRMRKGKAWQTRVPGKVLHMLQKMKAEERIRRL